MMQVFGRTDEQNEVTILSVSGDVDLAGLPALRSAIDRALLEGAEALVLDLGEVDSMDAMGVAVVSEFQSMCERAGTRCALAASNPEVRDYVTGRDSAIVVSASLHDALVSLQANVS